MNRRWMAALAAAALVLAGCGGGTDRTKAQVRLVNASSGYAQLELRVDDQVRQSGVSYGNSADYAEAAPGKSTTLFANGGAAALLTFTPSTSARNYYTVLAYGAAGSLKQVVLDDNQGQPDNNRSLLRVVNAAPDAGAVDVYVTGSSDTLAASVPVQAAAAVDSVGSFLTINSGTWRLRVTAAGSKTDLRLDIPSITLGSRSVGTLVITPGSGGVLTQALLLSQQGGIANLASTQARVRVATGLTGTGVHLGDTDLLAPGNSAAVTSYAVMAAGNQTLVVTVGGLAQASSVKSLNAGADYTLLIHGTAQAPLVSWVDDDNTRPSDATQAKVRLVNGMAGLSGNLSMTVDALPVAGNVAAGTASTPYAAVNATDVSAISVTAVGVGTPVFSISPQVLTAGGTYSVFVVGASGATSGVVRKDR